MKNYLDNLKNKAKKGKTLSVLAPMADVTDMVFRDMIAKYSKKSGPDIFWTEFVSADGLSHVEGKKKLLIDLKFNKQTERPILAQIFGSNINNNETAIKLIHKLGFDGVDFNFGCPDKTIEKQNCGSAMIKNQDLAVEVLSSAKDLINKLNTKDRFFSFSVKTRIGYNKIEYQTWFPKILNFEPDIFTIHLRTRKEMSLVDAHWELSKEIVDFIKDFCNQNNLKTPFIILNGDIKNTIDAKEKISLSKCDAVMIGRGVFGTPWLFDEKEYIKRKMVDLDTKKGRDNIKFRLETALEHTKNFENKLSKHKSFNIMKKHYKAYVNGFDGAKELRTDMMMAKDFKEVKKIVNKFLTDKNL